MAGKTMIDGTAYDISGGKTLVDGTAYSIAGGKTLVNGTGYDISFGLSPAVVDIWSGSNRCMINCITYADGYWVVGGQYHDGSNYQAAIAYSTSLNGTWTTVDLWSGTSGSNYVKSITYADGHWLVGGLCLDPDAIKYYARIAYATSLNGTWTTNDLWNHSSGAGIYSVAYGDGYWVVGGCRAARYARMAYTTSLDGAWTSSDLWTGSNNAYINSITYANGVWFYGAHRDSSSTDYACIGYTKSGNPPGNIYGQLNLWSDTNGGSTINSVTYADGKWVVGGCYESSSSSFARVAVATELNGSTSDWTILEESWKDSYGTSSLNSIEYGNGYWMVGGIYRDSGSAYYARIAYTTNLDASFSSIWTVDDLYGGSSLCYINGIIYADNYWVTGGYGLIDGTYYARIVYSPTPEGFNDI